MSYFWHIKNTKNQDIAMEKKITQENFEDTYVDSIELERIDKFVCDEMARQIHRYIKAMKGSKAIMLKFEEQLATLSIPEKEKAIARYIDLNRKVLSGLDFLNCLQHLLRLHSTYRGHSCNSHISPPISINIVLECCRHLLVELQICLHGCFFQTAKQSNTIDDR